MRTLKFLSYAALLTLAAAFIVATLPGCVSLEAPKSFNEKLAYGYASVAASRATAASMLERKRITVEEAQKAQALANQSRTALDLAKGTYATGDVSTAQGQLDLALTVVTNLEAFLKGKQ